MTDSSQPPKPTVAAPPGERRLANPPSDRYRVSEAEAAAAAAVDHGAPARGVAVAVVISIAGALAIVVVGGIVLVPEALVVVAGILGWAVAMGLRAGAGATLVGRRRAVVAVGLAMAAVALGQLGLWLFARSEGGVLAPLDYLGEVFGVLVPLQFGAAALGAWVAAR